MKKKLEIILNSYGDAIVYFLIGGLCYILAEMLCILFKWDSVSAGAIICGILDAILWIIIKKTS